MEFNDRGQFLNLAAAVEGSLVLIAVGLAVFTGVNPLELLVWSWQAALWGVAATLPLFLLFLGTYHLPIGPLRRIKQFLVESLGPALNLCRWYDLVLLAIAAGFCEEFLFRGVLQVWLERLGGPATGLIVSNLVFGLVHAVTITYAIAAMLIGIYLGLLLDITGEPNLVAPMAVHALYDYLAFLVVARTYRRQVAAAPHIDTNRSDA